MIEVENLTRYYGPVRAIHDVNFEVDQGEIIGFLGPNGAGKSTTMRILTGYLPASAGTARIAGFDVFYDSLEVRHRIGYMPETVPLYPEMTVQAYLRYMADLRQLPDAQEAVERAMDDCDVFHYAHTPISQLSKGYRQRVGLAQAILHEPEVLILDEPTIGLDPRQIAEVRALIQNLGREHTIILSSHILAEVSQTCSRMLIINNGEIVASGTPSELTDRVQDKDRVLVTIAGADQTTVTETLSQVQGVSSVDLTDGNTYQIGCMQGHDNRAQLAQTIVDRGWDLLELRTMSMSLEEIFLKLTEGATMEDLVEGYTFEDEEYAFEDEGYTFEDDEQEV